MSVRRSTAQEILDAEGWIPYNASWPYDIGSVVSAGVNRLGVPADSQLVIIGITSVEDTNALLARHNYSPTQRTAPYWYKVVAE